MGHAPWLPTISLYSISLLQPADKLTMTTMKVLMVVAVMVGAAAALKCWQTGETDGGTLLSLQTPTANIIEKECSTSDKTCRGEVYNVGYTRGWNMGHWGWHYKAGCSSETATKVEEMSQGSGKKYVWNCNTDFCNKAGAGTTPLLGLLLAAAALVFSMK